MHLPFPINFYLAALVCGALVTALSVPFWKRWCKKVELVDDPGHRKIHSETIPLAGGVAVLTGFFLPILFGGIAYFALQENFQPALAYGFSRRTFQILAIMMGAGAMVVLGALDDKIELSARTKFGGQLIIALLTAAIGVRITLFVESEIFSCVITVLWILTIVNAINFLDNMNGLCAGLGVIASWCCAWAAAVKGQYLVALLGFQICGALLGYIPFNFPKASIFLGDSGSHLVGYLVAVLAILPNYYSPELPNKWAVLAPIVILLPALFDLVSVVIIRAKLGKPFWIGDNNHISHRLTRRGLSRSLAVLIIWLAAAVCGALAFLGL